MENYLGETVLEISKTKYALYSREDWVLFWMEMYGGVDGAHHKNWLLDQIARIIKGTKITVKVAKWANGNEEERFNLDEPLDAYHEWVKYMRSGEDGPETYDYDIGIAP